MTSTSPHPDDFKGALGSWAAGVTVVTTRHDGLVYGITVSSFSSLSIDPLLVLVCLADSNRLPAMIQGSGHFAVSILAEGQEEVSSYFAVSGREPVEGYDNFETMDWHTGSPIISGSIAHLDCRLEQLMPGGDHSIAIGRVMGAAYNADLKPLIYYRRGYRKLVLD